MFSSEYPAAKKAFRNSIFGLLLFNTADFVNFTSASSFESNDAVPDLNSNISPSENPFSLPITV